MVQYETFVILFLCMELSQFTTSLFYVRKKILVDFHICISVPLRVILLMLVKILHPHVWAYQRVIGGMYGTRVHTSLKLSLN